MLNGRRLGLTRRYFVKLNDITRSKVDTIRVALTTPIGAINPVTAADAAGATLLQQAGKSW